MELIKRTDETGSSGFVYEKNRFREWDYRDYDIDCDNALLKGEIYVVECNYFGDDEFLTVSRKSRALGFLISDLKKLCHHNSMIQKALYSALSTLWGRFYNRYASSISWNVSN